MPLDAFLERVGMVDVADDRHARLFGQYAEHLAEHRNGRVPAAGRDPPAG